jgi:hypothetical protein
MPLEIAMRVVACDLNFSTSLSFDSEGVPCVGGTVRRARLCPAHRRASFAQTGRLHVLDFGDFEMGPQERSWHVVEVASSLL